jgi:hypothetical protein
MASFKTTILFIIISELEEFTVRMALYVKPSQVAAGANGGFPNNSSNNINDNEILIENIDDIVVSNGQILPNNLSPDQTIRADYNRQMKKFLQLVAVVLSLASAVYLGVKFTIVLRLIMQSQNSSDDAVKMPMNFFFFSILVVELAFSLVELIFSAFSWTFMRSLVKLVVAQNAAAKSNEDSNESSHDAKTKKPKVNLRRLIALSYPERFLIFIAFLMLIVSSITNIIVPYFFGAVVDSAQKYPSLDEMNKYIGLMFAVFLLGSVAGAIRSWLFELAGQRVVVRLRQNVFKAIVKQDIKFFDENRTGELTSRISSDTQVLQTAVTSNLSMLARYLLQIFGSVIFKPNLVQFSEIKSQEKNIFRKILILFGLFWSIKMKN